MPTQLLDSSQQNANRKCGMPLSAMKVILVGGSGHMGAVVRRSFQPSRYEFSVVTRTPSCDEEIGWDGKHLDSRVVDGADVVINLAGRTVNCRYNATNLSQMMSSRIDSTRAVGEAIAGCQVPPKVWLQASTATIYAHTFGTPQDEQNGVLAGNEQGVPQVWAYSAEIAKRWEAALYAADTPETRKVAMRMGIMMSRDQNGPLDILARLARLGLGGNIAGGRQFVSWVHERDLAHALEFLIDHDLSGPVNICSPFPLPQAEFAAVLREAVGTKVALGATKWMVDIAAYLMNSHSELVLKSRRVVPTKLLEAGFEFKYADWPSAVADLIGSPAPSR